MRLRLRTPLADLQNGVPYATPNDALRGAEDSGHGPGRPVVAQLPAA